MVKRPRPTKTAKASSSSETSHPTDPTAYALFSSTSSQNPLSNPQGPPPVFQLPNASAISQAVNLPPRHGQVGFALGIQTPKRPRPVPRTPASRLPEIPVPHLDLDTCLPAMSRHRRRKQKQWLAWTDEIIPLVLPVYLDLMASTDSLRLEPAVPDRQPCSCPEIRDLQVVVVRFCVLDRISIRACACQRAAEALVLRGLFPCAPWFPTLAVDIKVLSFVTKLFVRIPPNHTAWCQAVEDFLDSQGYKLAGEDSLRKRFSTALSFFNHLQHVTQSRVDKIRTHVRSLLLDIDELCVEVLDSVDKGNGSNTIDESLRHQSEVPLPSTPTRKRTNLELSDDEVPAGNNPFPDPPPRSRPSEYLRARCPACFGGKFPRPSLCGPDVLVCLDACFTQKRRPSERDPPIKHPRSVFIGETIIKRMDAYVSHTRAQAGNSSVESDDEDVIEEGLPVSNAVLAGCEKSFTAADESRTKASSQFFDCTALMGLLCRHDRVLWLANMTSAGEKQHYSFSLLETLFQHLPTALTVGVLYDIGCQIHRSCIKHGFLGRYLHRIKFGISVFHAFGHQWPCQIAYHPRKVEGFGLTDGEGCERFWKSISGLIAYLRVCGYNRRLYALDMQVQHDDQRSLLMLGAWIARKQTNMDEKLSESMHALSTISASTDTLRDQWARQVATQTKPLPRRGRRQGKTAVETALALMKARDTLRVRVQRLEDTATDLTQLPVDIAAAQDGLPAARDALATMESRFRRQREALGVDDTNRLRHLVNSPFINHRMNALALKTRLRDRLRQRRFEIAPLERATRRQGLDDKLRRHTQTAITRREPTSQALARRYNSLVDEMAALIRQGKAPRHAQLPSKIPLSGLFELDVDDNIWNDVGLLDEDDPAQVNPPPWLADEDVRAGIRALLVQDRCDEERSRLLHEVCSIQEWFSEEWVVIQRALELHQATPGLHYQLELYQDQLIKLCVMWQQATSWIPRPQDLDLPPWGPSVAQVTSANIRMKTQLAVDEPDEEDDFTDEEEEEDTEFITAVDAVRMADVFRDDDTMDNLDVEDSDPFL